MDRNLALEVVRVTEAAALESARLMGRGDASAVDRAASAAMRRAFHAMDVDATVVVGEGREGEVEGLFVGERIGAGGAPIDVALDALEGATVCATGGTNALSIILISERGRILSCPETYMDKLAVGPEGKGVVSLEKTPQENLRALADAKGVYVEDLTVVVLDRPRHDGLIDQVRKAGARVQILADGDLAAGIAASRPGSGIDILLGVGGAQQGVLAAGAIMALGGEFQGRFRPRNDDERNRLREAGIGDLSRIYGPADLVGDNVMFAATGVTNGHLLSGVRYFRGGATTNSVVMRSRTRTVRWIEAHHRFDFKPEY
ncbi:MAG: class II fructose-bisphosphatase [Candidatus Binatia bacterium]